MNDAEAPIDRPGTSSVWMTVVASVFWPFVAMALAEGTILLADARYGGVDSGLLWVVLVGGAGWSAKAMGARFPEARFLPLLYFILMTILLFAFGLMLDCRFNPRGCDL